jgi:hypothetical protein
LTDAVEAGRLVLPSSALARQLRERSAIVACDAAHPMFDQSGSSEPMKCRRQRLADEFAQIQNLAAFRDVREQYLDKGMLSVGRGAPLIFRAHHSLKRCKVQLAKRIVLITEQTLSSSTMLDGLRPNVHYLAAYERLDLFSPILGKKP